MLTERSNC